MLRPGLKKILNNWQVYLKTLCILFFRLRILLYKIDSSSTIELEKFQKSSCNTIFSFLKILLPQYLVKFSMCLSDCQIPPNNYVVVNLGNKIWCLSNHSCHIELWSDKEVVRMGFWCIENSVHGSMSLLLKGKRGRFMFW